MDQDQNRAADRSKPGSEPLFRFRTTGGPVLYFADFEAAVAFYTEVLGEPGSAEGSGTRGVGYR